MVVGGCRRRNVCRAIEICTCETFFWDRMKNDIKIVEEKEKDFAEEADVGRETEKPRIEDEEHRTLAASVIAIASAQL